MYNVLLWLNNEHECFDKQHLRSSDKCLVEPFAEAIPIAITVMPGVII